MSFIAWLFIYCFLPRAGGFPVEIIDFLASRGHVIHCSNSDYAVVQGVGVASDGNVTTHTDSRKQRNSSHD